MSIFCRTWQIVYSKHVHVSSMHLQYEYIILEICITTIMQSLEPPSMLNKNIHGTVVHSLNRNFYVLKLFIYGLDDHGHLVIFPETVPLVDGWNRKYIYASGKLFPHKSSCDLFCLFNIASGDIYYKEHESPILNYIFKFKKRMINNNI